MASSHNQQDANSANIGPVTAIANAVVNVMGKPLLSSQEKQGDKKLNQAYELVTKEVQFMVKEEDLKVVEERIEYARDLKVEIKKKSGIKKLSYIREYRSYAKEVYEYAKFITDRAALNPHFRFQAGPSSGTGDIDRIARFLYRCRLSCKDAFPTSSTQDVWMKDLWMEACYRTETDPSPNLLRQDEEFKCSSMELLKDMKVKIKSAVESSYGFDTSHAPQSISHNATRAHALLNETTFIYEEFNFGGLPCFPYRHPIIQKVVNVTWFQDKDDIGIIFHDYFSPIPFEAIALILTVIECCIDEWSTGTCQESSWKEVDYKANYLSHQNSLLDIRNRSPQHRKGRDILRQIQDDLLKAAREHAGVPPVPTTGARKLSTYAIDAAIEEDDPLKYDSDYN